MDNIFQVGGQVSGSSFIGRKSLLEKFRRIYLDSSSRVCKSVVGLTRIGKSSFASELFSKVPQNIILIREDLKEIPSYAELWQDISYTLEDALKERNLNTPDLGECISILNSFNNVPWIKFIRYVKKLFSKIKEAGFKVIIVIDEFDYAQELFKNETKYYELFRTLFSAPEYSISALLISRRSLHVIEGATYQSSTFHGVFDPIQFPGFENDDLEEYYSVFDSFGIKLADEDKSIIEFYAGRLPFLLSILGHYIVEEYAFKNTCVNIHELFLTKCKAINDYYRDCIKHLERDNDLNRIIPFVTGPNFGVTKSDKDELISSGYLIVRNNTFIPISEYFQSFLTVARISFPLGVMITSVEKLLKEIVKTENLSADDLRLNDQMTAPKFLSDIVNIDQESINRYTIFISSVKKNFGKESTFLDVLSLKHVVRIIKLFWNVNFSRYFNNDPADTWNIKFDLCAKARNPVQHAHEDYYSEAEKCEIDNYCKQIIDCLSKKHVKNTDSNQSCIKNIKSDKETTSSVPIVKTGAYFNNNQRKPSEINKTPENEITVEVTGINTNSNGLRGRPVKPDHNLYRVSFVKSSLPDNYKELVGKRCSCEIVNADSTKKLYVVRYIEVQTDDKKNM